MCYTAKLDADLRKAQSKFPKRYFKDEPPSPNPSISAFTHPFVAILTNAEPLAFQNFSWGLMPNWSQDLSFRKNTLNAKIESIAEKPSFQAYQTQRCIIPINGFYEWQWLDKTGKKKKKFLLEAQSNEIFVLAGIWNIWKDHNENTLLPCFSVLTTEAQGIMETVHNSKLRMPIAYEIEQGLDWLEGANPNYITDFKATDLEPSTQISLF